MKILIFAIGGSTRKVTINGREITLLTAELGFAPLRINLDKLNDKETRKIIKQSKMDDEILIELSKLKTEKEIAKDIIKDFQKSGWRLIRKSGMD